jgi:CheY-like chemotaxis protein
MIFVIDDDRDFAECIARMLKAFCDEEVAIFGNAIDAVTATSEEIPKLIFLDILLDGPDGWTFLNEMMSYGDTEKIPIVIMSSLDFADKDLSNYGVVTTLNKSEMTPEDIRELVEEYVK